jgi:hypothetical protein
VDHLPAPADALSDGLPAGRWSIVLERDMRAALTVSDSVTGLAYDERRLPGGLQVDGVGQHEPRLGG